MPMPGYQPGGQPAAAPYPRGPPGGGYPSPTTQAYPGFAYPPAQQPPYPGYVQPGGYQRFPAGGPVGQGGGYPPSVAPVSVQPLGGQALSDDQIRQSLLSAVEDKMRRRLKEIVDQSHVSFIFKKFIDQSHVSVIFLKK